MANSPARTGLATMNQRRTATARDGRGSAAAVSVSRWLVVTVVISIPLRWTTWCLNDRRRRSQRGSVPGRISVSAVRRTCGGLALPRNDHAVLVGEDHRLHPVAEAELAEHVADMGLGRRLRDEKALGDVDVREAA